MTRLTQKSRTIIANRLKLRDLSQVFDQHSSGVSGTRKLPVNRERTKLYVKNIRGAIRLKTGRFYTPDEWVARKKRIKLIKLP